MGANDKVAAALYPNQTVTPSTPEPTVLDSNSLADLLCDQLQLFTEEGGNDMQGEYVDEVTLGGRIITVDWSNGQQFQIEVIEVLPHSWDDD
jgi:hypothetical protein